MSSYTHVNERPDVSIVVPLYNEEESAGPLCMAIREALENWPRTYEVILVDDGSTDETVPRVRGEQSRDPRIRLIALKANSGQTLAMATGFQAATGDIVVSMDGDLQNDPRDIPLMVRELESGYDVVCGWRKNRKDAFLSRTLPSKIANKLIAWMTGVPIHDNGCSLKAYRTSVIQSLNLYAEMHRFLPALSAMSGARIQEVVVRHHARAHGESKYGISRTFKVLSDMFAIKMIVHFSRRPGIWFAKMGLPWLVLAVVALVGWLFGLRARDPGDPVSIVFSSLAVIFCFLFGYMMTMAVLSELLLLHSNRRFLRRFAMVLARKVSFKEPVKVERHHDGE